MELFQEEAEELLEWVLSSVFRTWTPDLQKKAIKALQIISDSVGITQEALKEYGRLFKHPLSQMDVEALSALFGWHIPNDLQFQ